MGRPNEIKNRRTINVVVDGDDADIFIKEVGPNNFSKEIRAFIKDRVEQSKKEEGQLNHHKHIVDSLDLPIKLYPSKDELINCITNEDCFKFIDNLNDTAELAAILERANKRRLRLIKTGNFLCGGRLMTR